MSKTAIQCNELGMFWKVTKNYFLKKACTTIGLIIYKDNFPSLSFLFWLAGKTFNLKPFSWYLIPLFLFLLLIQSIVLFHPRSSLSSTNFYLVLNICFSFLSSFIFVQTISNSYISICYTVNISSKSSLINYRYRL